MGKKLQQVTDNIHGTIYLSNLESEMISTPYFYRLHDIYQSSTVYMTFPSNRTKRYEHSLGTMELASTILYTAVLNADPNTKEVLFNKLDEYFKQAFDLIINNFEDQTALYFTKNKELLEELFSNGFNDKITKENLYNDIEVAIANGCFSDSALDYFQYYPMQNENNTKNFFLYRCLLQAIRIIALFHDVGHPPYSHIIEEVLNNLSKEISNFINNGSKNEKYDDFNKCMKNYSENIKTQTIFSKLTLPDSNSALHERIGLSFLQSAINDTIPNIVKDILISDRSKSCKISSVLYYVLIVEFAISMLVERDLFFKSFHKIVDGVLDADRLDYITRDSQNSGVDWGRIPYKRLINSSKLIYLKNYEGVGLDNDEHPFIIAYPEKVTTDIEDLLLTRYKIFERINFHHRCIKTAAALKSSVKILANNYLSSKDDEKCINPDIKMLWTSLGLNAGDRKKRVILWNDSWLISTLYRALINLNGRQDKQSIILKENLEEILLNKKRFYSLLKRKKDNQKFLNKIFEFAGITETMIAELLQREEKKLSENKEDIVTENNIFELAKADALDSLGRITEIISNGDVEALSRFIPTTEKSINEIISDSLEELRKQGYLLDYSIIINNDRKKTGLPRHENLLDEIYLYNDNTYFPFDEYISLKPQIEAIHRNIPWLYIYIAPGKLSTDINQLTEKVLDEAARNISSYIKRRFGELFPNIPNFT